MQNVRCVYWQEGNDWLGYNEEFPDDWTQGETLDDLKEHLRDWYSELTGGALRGIRRVGELAVHSDPKPA